MRQWPGQSYPTSLTACWLTHLDEGRDDRPDGLVDDLKAVGVVQTHDVGAHEGEDGHDVVQDFLLGKNRRGGGVKGHWKHTLDWKQFLMVYRWLCDGCEMVLREINSVTNERLLLRWLSDDCVQHSQGRCQPRFPEGAGHDGGSGACRTSSHTAPQSPR